MFRKLASYVKEYKKSTILTPIFVILEVVMEVIIPLLMAKIIDVGIQNGDVHYILEIGGLLIVCAILSLTFGMLSGRFAAKASAGYAKNLRKEMFYKIQDYSFENIDKFSTSSLVTRMTTDVTNVQMAFQMIIRILVRGPIMMIFSLLMVASISAKLSVIFLVAIPVLGVILFFIATKAHPNFERVFKKYDKLNNVVQENVSAIRVVKAYVKEGHEKEKFEKVNSEVYTNFKKAQKIVAFNGPVMQFTIYTCILLISWIGSGLIIGGQMQTGELSSIITYAWQILASLMMISFVFVMVIMAQSSAERIIEVIEENPTIKNKEKPIEKVKDGSITFENVSFRYSDEEDENNFALENINLEIKEGETIGVIGGTGSSKSTLVQLIPRLYDVTKGSIKVGGVDVRDYDIKALREEVAMVLQKNVLFSGSIAENLRWGKKNADQEELEEVCKLAQADGFIKEFPSKYDTILDQGGTNVSGGQKQRICIARAILKQPKILILDDSTSAVDTKTDALIRKAFREKIPNTTKIIIAQRISSIEDADKIIVLNDGKIDGIGTSEELLKTNAIYQEVYESQMKGGDDNEEN
ncbi:MAG TPA: ABC transporter ATP-binding protein [Candidatus Merdicola faecigallinarum]|uniref:ABC transporter ATP-binding protein n=1 Tax=Candidatus Merdicola faecigallinarum TaxID=2840862 RepID=A0A9D1M1E4_9FIRM|nr:ABC transporter ATP-binding protein [Candidatus Merdicola faecigallinarum]